MGWWEDLRVWFVKAGNSVVQFIVDAAGFLKEYMRSMRADMIVGLQAAMGHPGRAILIILGFTAIQMVLQALYDAIGKTAIMIKLQAFLVGIGDVIQNLAKWMQLDMFITLMQLGMILNDGFYKQITKVYMALGDLAAELELDFGFITAFTETSRAIIHAMNAVTGGTALKAEAEYAAGLSEFLKGIQAKLGSYAKDPSLIFLDVQNNIILSRLGTAEEAVGRIWAAIDMSADWIRDTGNMVLEDIAGINAALDLMPEEIKTAIDTWYAPIREKLDEWTKEVWGPFWTRYSAAELAIDRHFARHDLDIDQLQRDVGDPITLLRMALSLGEKERREKLADLDNLVATVPALEILPVIDSLSSAFSPLIADGLALLDNPPLPEPPGEVLPIEIIDLPIGPVTIEGPALKETGSDPYPPGGQKADGRSWYVG